MPSEPVPGSPVEQIAASTAQAESTLHSSFAAELGPDLEIADFAAAMLLAVLLRTQPELTTADVDIKPDGTLSGDIPGLIRASHIYIGIRAWRAMRAARAVLAVGYEGESRALDRILVELHVHRRAIMDDETGKEALAWLQGRSGYGISKRVKKLTRDDLYKNMSEDSHGDPASVQRLFDATSNSLLVSPRRTHATRASLLLQAGFARDQAMVISQASDLELDGLENFDGALARRWEVLRVSDPNEAAP